MPLRWKRRAAWGWISRRATRSASRSRSRWRHSALFLRCARLLFGLLGGGESYWRWWAAGHAIARPFTAGMVAYRGAGPTTSPLSRGGGYLGIVGCCTPWRLAARGRDGARSCTAGSLSAVPGASHRMSVSPKGRPNPRGVLKRRTERFRFNASARRPVARSTEGLRRRMK